MRKLSLTAVTAAGLLTSMLAVPATGAVSAPPGYRAPAAFTVAASSPLLGLPVGAVPVGVPYGIGKTIYLNGRGYDQSSRWATLTSRTQPSPGYESAQFGDLAISRGVIIWSINTSCVDPCAVVGNLVPGSTAKRLTIANSYPGLAVTTGGLVTAGLDSIFVSTVPILTTAGTAYPPPFTWDTGGPPTSATAQGVGGSFVFQGFNNPTQQDAAYTMYPGYPPVRLPHDNTYGVGQGSGWLATADSYGSVCYRTAAFATPGTLRARICSQTLPLVSPDGTKVVVVQGNHVRLYNTITGAQINATIAPTLAAQGYQPIQWETANAYLVYAADGASRVIMRCSLNRTCQRAVTVTTRTGITRIAY